jgi:hypothetical protein
MRFGISTREAAAPPLTLNEREPCMFHRRFEIVT